MRTFNFHSFQPQSFLRESISHHAPSVLTRTIPAQDHPTPIPRRFHIIKLNQGKQVILTAPNQTQTQKKTPPSRSTLPEYLIDPLVNSVQSSQKITVTLKATSDMVTKLAVALLAALAITAQAGHAQHHHAKRHYGYGSVPNNSTSVVPQSTPSVSPAPISSSSAPIGTGFTASPVSVSSGTSVSASPLPSSSAPLGTGPSASLSPSSSVSVSQPNAPFPTSSGSLSASQNPSSKVPLGTGVTVAPSKVSILTSDTVLTYTIGTGSSTTVIITTIRHTLTSTLLKVSVKETPRREMNKSANQANRPSMQPRHQTTNLERLIRPCLPSLPWVQLPRSAISSHLPRSSLCTLFLPENLPVPLRALGVARITSRPSATVAPPRSLLPFLDLK